MFQILILGMVDYVLTRRFIIHNYRALYSKIYEFSNSDNGPVTYTLSEAANARYEAFIDAIAASLNSQWQKNACPEDVSKDDRHVLRLAAVLHVVYDQLTKMLRGEDEPSPPGGEISLITLEQSIALCNYFTEQRRILDQVSEPISCNLANDN